MVSLEHDTCFHLTIHLDNPFSSALNQSYESFYSFDPSKECPNTCRIMFWSILSLCCQVLCRASVFKGSLHLKVSYPQYYQFPYPCQSIFYHFPVTSFVSIDGGYINSLLRRVFSCRIQQIIQEIDLGTHQYLGTYMPQWQASSHSEMGIHQ
jgi:hypothetical protein